MRLSKVGRTFPSPSNSEFLLFDYYAAEIYLGDVPTPLNENNEQARFDI